MEFWRFIEQHCRRPFDAERCSAALEAALRRESVEDVRAFCVEFDRNMAAAYRWDLWGVAYLINSGCSDDGFLDFRASLIALGEDTFNAALRDPESLIELGRDELAALFEEG